MLSVGATLSQLNRYTEKKSPEKWSPENLSLKNWSPEKWSPENWSLENWSPEEWSPENWSPEKWFPENWSPENWSPENWSPEKIPSKIVLRQKKARKVERIFYFYPLIPLHTQQEVWRSPHDFSSTIFPGTGWGSKFGMKKCRTTNILEFQNCEYFIFEFIFTFFINYLNLRILPFGKLY